MMPGIKSLYYLAKLAQKQVVYVTQPPTILLGFNHDNMFIYTKASTKCLTVKTQEMTPKLIMHYIRHYMDRGGEEDPLNQNSRIKSSVYPKFIIKYTSNTNKNKIYLFYKASEVFSQAIEDWGKYDMAIQPFIIGKTRKASMLRYELYNKSMIKSYALSSECSITKFPYLSMEEIINKRKDALWWSENPTQKKENISEELKTPLHKINNIELIKYFCVSTDCVRVIVLKSKYLLY